MICSAVVLSIRRQVFPARRPLCLSWPGHLLLNTSGELLAASVYGRVQAEPTLTVAVDEPAPSKTDSAIACDEAGTENAVKHRNRAIPMRTLLFIGTPSSMFSKSSGTHSDNGRVWNCVQ
jgi:hypothetical protein